MATFALDALFRAVYQSVVEATHAVQDRAWESMEGQYFDKAEDGTLSPKMVRISVPHVDQGRVETKPLDVPLIALTKHQAITMDEMTMEFEVELRSLKEDDASLAAVMPRGVWSRNPTAKVTIKFKGSDPSEGLMLLNDKAHSMFPR